MPVVLDENYSLILDPNEVATNREQLYLNAEAGIAIEQPGIDWGDAAVTAFLADKRLGSAMVDYRVPNRVITVPLALGMDNSGSFDSARLQLQQKIALIQEQGGWLKRSTSPPLYADIVNASMTMPDQWGEAGGLEPGVKLNLECSPDFYGDEIILDTMYSGHGTIAQVLTSGSVQANIMGATAGRLWMSISSVAVGQKGLLWALRSKYYDSTQPVVINAKDCTLGGSSTVSVDADSASGSAMNAILATPNSWQDIVNLWLPASFFGHVGSYRVWARVKSSTVAESVGVRLVWDLGGLSSFVTNPVSILDLTDTGYQVMDLGQVSLRPIPVGTQAWLGKIKARGKTGSELFSVDQIYLQSLDDFAGHLLASQETDSPDWVVPAGAGTAELRWDGTYRSAIAGYKPISTPIGDFPRIPVSGMEQRAVELFMKTYPGTTSAPSAAPISDFQVDLRYRPCYLFRP